jgi:hypothetical protein
VGYFVSLQYLMKSFLSVVVLLMHIYVSNGMSSDTGLIREHLRAITKTEGSRNHLNIALLDKTADYIYKHFKLYADTVYYQDYKASGLNYKNVVCVFGSKESETIVIGAHYDVCEEQQGADDNASGVVGLLELARMLKGQKPTYRIELVAYSLEEPPYFLTESMGSYIHAKSLSDAKRNVYGMISLEMIGYFNDSIDSQTYPAGFLKTIYGSKGNYITLVKKFGSGKFARKFCRKFKRKKTIRTIKFTAPAKMEGIDYSDHRNYWIFGYSALMITDTSFFRNNNYHEKTDTMETLDIKRMAKVIDGVYLSLSSMTN